MLQRKIHLHLGTAGAILMVLVSALTIWAEPVHFKELVAILAAVEPPQGWEVSQKPKGTTLKSPVQMSEAEMEFRAGDQKTVEIRIIDSVAAMMPYVGLTQQMEMESSEEYMKSIEIQGFKGLETFKHQEKRGEIILPVAGRFLVTLTVTGMDNTELIKELAGKLDLKKLAALAAKGK